MSAIRNLWKDEEGFVISAELVLIATILVIGMIAGLTSLRDAALTELADVGAAIGNANQSFVFGGAVTASSNTVGSLFTDQTDFCDLSGSSGESRCLTICGTGTAETVHP